MTVWRIETRARQTPEAEAAMMEGLTALLPNLEDATRAGLCDLRLRDFKGAFGNPAAIIADIAPEAAAMFGAEIDVLLQAAALAYPGPEPEAAALAYPGPEPEEVQEEARHAAYELSRFIVNAINLYREEAQRAKACETMFLDPVRLIEAFETAPAGSLLRDCETSLFSSIAVKPEVARQLLRVLVDRLDATLPLELPLGMALLNDRNRDRGGCCGGHGFGEPKPCPSCSVISTDCAAHVGHMVIDHGLLHIPSVPVEAP